MPIMDHKFFSRKSPIFRQKLVEFLAVKPFYLLAIFIKMTKIAGRFGHFLHRNGYAI
jgi:hypothetical protein